MLYSKKIIRHKKRNLKKSFKKQHGGGTPFEDMLHGEPIRFFFTTIMDTLNLNQRDTTDELIQKLKTNFNHEIVIDNIHKAIDDVNLGKTRNLLPKLFSCSNVRILYENLISNLTQAWINKLDNINLRNNLKAKALGCSYIRFVCKRSTRRLTENTMRTKSMPPFGCPPEGLRRRDAIFYNDEECNKEDYQCPSNRYLYQHYGISSTDPDNDTQWNRIISSSTRRNSDYSTMAVVGKMLGL
jgi:hypothetical protein